MSLHWTPLFESIIRIGGQCNLLIAPFIQTEALKALLRHFDSSKLQVITSWTAVNLAAGVSDPGVYVVLKELNVPLYIHPDIHLKLFVFENDVAFHTSANITAKGLGLAPNCNIEIGCCLTLNLSDWLGINEILETSCRVTDLMHALARQYAVENKHRQAPLPALVLPTNEGVHPFSRLALPQCPSPEELWKFYSTGAVVGAPRATYMHDLWLYKITNANLSKEQFFHQLGVSFQAHPFVKALVSHVKERKTLHFGAVNAWIASNCSDRPTPLRWELKPATSRLYNWLEILAKGISWQRPNHSQILLWNENDT
jgi:hypothetical protein